MWWPILESLGNALKAAPALADVPVRYGFDNPLEAGSGIELVRAGLEWKPNELEGAGRIEIGCWETIDETEAARADDRLNGTGYARLHALEQAVLAAAQDWLVSRPLLPDLAIRGEIPEVLSDGEIFRPHIGSFIQLQIQFKAKRQ